MAGDYYANRPAVQMKRQMRKQICEHGAKLRMLGSHSGAAPYFRGLAPAFGELCFCEEWA
jgi:hypothetical protein